MSNEKTQPPNYRYSAPVLGGVERKTIVDAPNLRTADERACGTCKHFKWLREGDGICNQFQFEADCEYICDAWTADGPYSPGPLPVVIVGVDLQAATEMQNDLQTAGDLSGEKSFEVKFVGDPADGIVRGYRVLWGGPEMPDASKLHDYFRKETDFMQDKFPLPHPLFFHHGLDAKTNADPHIGTVVEQGTDEWGIWYKAQLRRAEAYDKYAAELMQNVRLLISSKALKDSSDAIPQYTIREPQANGTHFVKRWALVAQSLTPIPAEPRMRPVSELQAAYKSMGVDLQLPEASAETGDRADAVSAASNATKASGQTAPKENEMTREEMLALMREEREREQKEAEAKAAEEKRINTLAEAKAQARLDELAKQNRVPLFAANGAAKTSVSLATKYDSMSPADLAFLAVLRSEAKTIGKSAGADETLLRTLAVKSIKAVEQGKLEAKALEDLFPDMRIEAKSNEVMQSTLTSYGDEWVPTNFSSQLWTKIRDSSRLVQRIEQQEIPRGYESDTIPLEGTDFTFYNVAQTSAEDSTMKTPVASVPSSKYGTGQRVITVGKLGARGEISGELDEDSIIDSIPEARRKLEAQLPIEMEFLMLNADDTAATGNINGNGTPTSGADYTLWKGMMVLGLTTNTANKYDMGATLNTTKIAAFYATLGSNGLYVYQNPGQCLVVVDGKSWLTKVWTLSDLLTVANAGEMNATINRGAQADGGIPIFGVPWYPSAGVKLAQATGIRHSATGDEDGSDTYGRAVLVRPDLWKMRWKRRAKYETVRIPRADVTEIVVTMRFGIGYYDTDAASVAYDI